MGRRDRNESLTGASSREDGERKRRCKREIIPSKSSASQGHRNRALAGTVFHIDAQRRRC